MKLKNLLTEAETFTATNKKTGKTSVFNTKDSRDAAIKAGTHTKVDSKKQDTDDKPSKPSVNIFNNPAPAAKGGPGSGRKPNPDKPSKEDLRRQAKLVKRITTQIKDRNPSLDDNKIQKIVDKIVKRDTDGRGYFKPKPNIHMKGGPGSGRKKEDTPVVQSTKIKDLMPKADKDTFNAPSDINKIPDSEKREISMKIDELDKLTKDAEAQGKDAPNYNLCNVTVPGTNLYCSGNAGIPREEMPQFKGKPTPGSPADKLPKDKKGEVDTEPMFKEMLKKNKVKTVETEIPSDRLKATQSELVGSKVAGMAKALEEDPNNPGITAPIYVSRDGYVIDGHHRWAAVTSAAIKAGKPANMKVIVIDMDIKDAIPMCNKFAEEQGVAAKKADANQEGPAKEEPKSEPKKKRPGNPKVNKDAKKLAEKSGITPQKLGNEKYKEAMFQAAVSALTDSNFHSEARELVAAIEGKPELAKKPEYPSIKDPKYKEKMDDIRKNSADGSIYMNGTGAIDDYGTEVSQAAGWDGVEAADGIAFTLRMNGFHKEADLIQSVFDNKPYMKKESIKLGKLVK